MKYGKIFKFMLFPAGIAAVILAVVLWTAGSRSGGGDSGVWPGKELLDTSALMLGIGTESNEIPVSWVFAEDGRYELCWARTDGDGAVTIPMEQTETMQEGWYCYTAEMAGLLPGSEYEYYISAADRGSESKRYRIITGDPETVRFLFAGDVQIGAGDAGTDAGGWSSLLCSAAENPGIPDLLITAGDQSDSQDTGEAFLQYLGFRSPELLKCVPTAVNRGNHEAGETEGLFDEQFDREEGWKGDYYFIRGDALFAAIDSNSEEYGGHLEFLKEAVQMEQKRWVIVTMHHSMFGAKDRGSGSKSEKARDALADAFSELGVDLVLSGHDHTYARSYYMDGSLSTGKADGKKENGEVVYLSGGSASGSKFYDGEEEYPYLAFVWRGRQASISQIEIEGDQITVRTYAMGMPGLNLIDSFVIVK